MEPGSGRPPPSHRRRRYGSLTQAWTRQRPNGLEQNVWPGQVNGVDLMGDRVRVGIDGTPAITAEVLPRMVDELKLDDGGEV